MKTWLLLLGCLLALASQAQTRREVYEWKDAQGVTHYSDYPQPGARKIILHGSSTITSAPKATTTAAGAKPAAQPAAQEIVYDRLAIWSPEVGANFFEPDSVITIRIRSEPEVYHCDSSKTNQRFTPRTGQKIPRKRP